jgi:CheY-like chemotaxis protein
MTDKQIPEGQDTRPYVLIADDDPDIRDAISVACQIRGWRVDTAATAREAIDKVNEHCENGSLCYDLIIMDINFRDRSPDPGPRLTGITAAREIQKAYGSVPIIFYTGWDNSIVRDEARPFGEFIVKSKGQQDVTSPTGESETIDGDIQSVLHRAEYWITHWRAATYEGPERRGGMSSFENNQGRRATDRPRKASVPKVLDEAIQQVRQSAAG